jgi:Cu/Ag efflux pump CusA
MITWIAESGLRLGRLVIAAAIAFAVIGVTQLGSAAVEVYPEFSPLTVEVQTESLGLSAAEVESFVTVPLEQDLLNGVPWLDHISSRSVPGLSAIDLVFQPGTEGAAARQMVQERMTQIRALPNVGTPPVMIQPVASTSRVAMISLSTSDATKLSLVDLSVLARWKIRARLMGVPGVSNVAIYGQRDRQLQVQVDPDKMKSHHVALTDVVTTAGNALWVSPLTFVQASTPGTGGFIESPNQRLPIQHILPINSAAELAKVPLSIPGNKLLLGDVATVAIDHQPLIGDAVVNGASSLVMVVEKFPEASTVDVTRQIETAMRELKPGLSGITVDTHLYRPATYIESSLHSLGVAAAAGALLLFVCAFLLMSWRFALVTTLAVSLSMVSAAVVLRLLGATFTSMTLIGLAAALALVVDDVVSDLFAVRRQRPVALDADGQPAAARTARLVAAVVTNRGTLLYATVGLLLMTVPALLLSPFVRAFSQPAVFAYAVAAGISLVVALLVTPSLALLFGVDRGGLRTSRLSRLGRGGHAAVAAAIRGVLRRPRRAGILAVILAACVLAVVPQLVGPAAWLPAPQDPNLLVQLRSLPGTSLAEMDRVTTVMSREVGALAGVTSVGVHVGRAVTADEYVDVNSAEIWIGLDKGKNLGRARAAITAVASSYPGIKSDVGTYPAGQLSGAQAGSTRGLVVRVFGNDLLKLRATSEQVQAVVAGVPGVAVATLERSSSQPAVEVVVDLQRAQALGLRPGDVRRAATTMMSGLLVGNLYESQAVFDVVVVGPQKSDRSTLSSLQDLPIDIGGGRQVPLHDVASVRLHAEPTAVRHESVARSVDISVKTSGRSMADVAADLDIAVAGVAMPQEFHARVIATDGPIGSGVPFAAALLLVALAIFLVLQAATRSWSLAVGLFVLLPLAGGGAVIGAALAGGIKSAAALAGLVAVLGVTLRQSLLLVHRTQALVAESSDADVIAAIFQAARERIAPVLVSMLGTAALVAPVLLLGNQPGLEHIRALVLTLLGGLITSAVVVLALLPVLCAVVGRVRPRLSASRENALVRGMS